MTNRREVSALPFVVLLFSFLIFKFNSKYKPVYEHHGQNNLFFPQLVGFFILMQLGWICVDMFTGIFKYLLRVFFFQVIPVLIFFIIMSLDGKHYRKIIDNLRIIIVLSGILVSLELYYEWYHVNVMQSGPTKFMRAYLEYYITQGGTGSLEAFFEGATGLIRCVGLMEHLHFTTLYIGISSVTALCLYFKSSGKLKIFYVVCSIIMFGSIVIVGSRTAAIATLVSFYVLFIYLQRGLLKEVTILLVSAILAAAFIDFYTGGEYKSLNNFFRIYDPDFVYRVMTNYIHIVENEMSMVIGSMVRYPATFIFGAGPGIFRDLIGLIGSSDFYLVELFMNYGFLGLLLLSLMIFLYMTNIIRAVKSVSGEEKIDGAYSLSLVILFLISTLHSGAILNKGIYSSLFLAYGIGWKTILLATSRRSTDTAIETARRLTAGISNMS